MSTSSFKLNTDGVRNLNSGFACSATVAHDDHDRWMWGVGRNTDRCSLLQAKLWAISDGFQITWEANWENIIIEIDYAFNYQM